MCKTTVDTQEASNSHPPLVDIGINPTRDPLHDDWRGVIRRAVDANVKTILLTGTSMHVSHEVLKMAKTWKQEQGSSNLFTTVGVHPCDAHTFSPFHTIKEMRNLLKHDQAVAVGECGLDYCKGTSSKAVQKFVFRQQVQLARELSYPLFLHERMAHQDFIDTLDDFDDLPPIVVHCFTGTAQVAEAYLQRGYYIGFTGVLCRARKGQALRDLLPRVPLNRILLETDAPFMPFRKGRTGVSEPADLIDLARKVSHVLDMPVEDVCQVTTQNAQDFFRIHN